MSVSLRIYRCAECYVRSRRMLHIPTGLMDSKQTRKICCYGVWRCQFHPGVCHHAHHDQRANGDVAPARVVYRYTKISIYCVLILQYLCFTYLYFSQLPFTPSTVSAEVFGKIRINQYFLTISGKTILKKT